MFKIGEVVIHPALGPCRIKAIEERKILQETQKCFILIPIFDNENNLTIILPVQNSKKIGLRKPLSQEKIEEIKEILSQKIDGRKIDNQEISLPILQKKLSSGNPYIIAEIIRDLHAKIRQDGGKYASARRRSFLKKAEQRLIREISLSTGLSIKEVRSEINLILRA